MRYFQKFLHITFAILIVVTIASITNPCFGMKSEESQDALASQTYKTGTESPFVNKNPENNDNKEKKQSIIPTKGEIEELTFEEMDRLIKDLKKRKKDKSMELIEIREELWVSLKTPDLTLANLEAALGKYPGAIAILTDTLDVKRQQTTMGTDYEGPISQFTLYFGDDEIEPRVRFNVAFSQKKLLRNQSSPSRVKKSKKHRKFPVYGESMIAVQKTTKNSKHHFIPPESIEGEALEKILSLLKDFDKFITLGEKELPVIPLPSKHIVTEVQKKSPKAYDMKSVELEINGKKMTFKYTDPPLKIAYLRRELDGIPLDTITAVLEENDGIPQPYATQGERSISLLCRYALYGKNGEQLQYKSHSGTTLKAVIEMTINLSSD